MKRKKKTSHKNSGSFHGRNDREHGIKLVIIERKNMERNMIMVGFDSILQFKYKQGKVPTPRMQKERTCGNS